MTSLPIYQISPFIQVFYFFWASLVAQLVKNPPAMQETWVRSLGWEDPLEKGKATHSSILAWRIPVHGVTESDVTEQLSLSLLFLSLVLYNFPHTGSMTVL